MAGDVIYAFRVTRLPLLDAGGAQIGRIEDIVVVPGRPGKAPRVVGFVANSQRRRIFVNWARIGQLDGGGAQLRSWDVDLHPFRRRAGETLIGAEIIDQSIALGESVSDVGLEHKSDDVSDWWEVSTVRLVRRHVLKPRPSYRLVDWRQVQQLFAAHTAMAAEAARLRDMHPSDVAVVVRALPQSQRRQLAEAMDDERLADLLEELPEDEQLRLIEGLDLDRLVGVLEEMEYDDLTDLLGEMPDQQREAVLEAMDDEDAEVLTRLLSYDERTAGGLMTPDVIILGPDDNVAEALAQLRDPNWSQAVASQVFICQGPFMPPTGRYLGVVYAQRLLREPPSMTLGRCLRNIPTTTPDAPEQEVHEQFAHYNLMALPVLDEAGRLLGAIAVDDVVDRLLGVDWRSRQRRRTTPVQPMVTP